MTNHDVIGKLLGPIEPVGETNEDERRYKNLDATIELVEKLCYDIYCVSRNKDRQEYSMKRAGITADKFLKNLVEEYK